MDGVGDDFVGIVKRLLPGQQDGGAGDGLGVSVSGRAGPVLRHDDNQSSQGQNRALLVLRQALIDGIILGDDLSYHQFTAEQDKVLEPKGVHCFAFSSHARVPAVHLNPAVEVNLFPILEPADPWWRHPLSLAHEASGAGSGAGLALRLLHDGRRHWNASNPSSG